MSSVRRKLVKTLLAFATGGVGANQYGSGGGGVDETLFYVWRIVDVWT